MSKSYVHVTTRQAGASYRRMLEDPKQRTIFGWTPERPLFTAGSVAVLTTFVLVLLILSALPPLVCGAQ